MIAKLRCYAEKMKIGVMMLTFLFTIAGGGYAVHRAMIGEVRAEIQSVHHRIDKVDDLRKNDRAEISDRLKTIEFDIKQILRQVGR